MKKFLKKNWILILVFILQTINVIWSFTNPNIHLCATYFAAFVDGWIFACLIDTLRKQ